MELFQLFLGKALWRVTAVILAAIITTLRASTSNKVTSQYTDPKQTRKMRIIDDIKQHRRFGELSTNAFFSSMDNISMQFHDCLEATAGNNFVIINILTDGCCLDNWMSPTFNAIFELKY